MNKAVFFDLYGTLIDIRTDESDQWVYENLSRYLSYHSIGISADELKKEYFERVQQKLKQNPERYPEVDIFQVFFEILSTYGKKRYTKSFVINAGMLFRSLTIRNFGLFPGLYEILYFLCNTYKCAIISDAQWVYAEPEIGMLGLDQFFKIRILSSRFGYKKPDRRLFDQVIDKLRVDPAKSVYVGDNPVKDLLAAKNAGLKFILFRSDCREYNGLRPDACFSDYSELEGILKEVML